MNTGGMHLHRARFQVRGFSTWPGNRYEFHSFGGAFTSDSVMPAMTAISYHRGSCAAPAFHSHRASGVRGSDASLLLLLLLLPAELHICGRKVRRRTVPARCAMCLKRNLLEILQTTQSHHCASMSETRRAAGRASVLGPGHNLACR